MQYCLERTENCFNEVDFPNNHKQPNRHLNFLLLIVKVTSTSLYRWDCRQNRLMIIPKRHFQHSPLDLLLHIHRHNCSYMRHLEIYDLYVFILLFFLISSHLDQLECWQKQLSENSSNLLTIFLTLMLNLMLLLLLMCIMGNDNRGNLLHCSRESNPLNLYCDWNSCA